MKKKDNNVSEIPAEATDTISDTAEGEIENTSEFNTNPNESTDLNADNATAESTEEYVIPSDQLAFSEAGEDTAVEDDNPYNLALLEKDLLEAFFPSAQKIEEDEQVAPTEARTEVEAPAPEENDVGQINVDDNEEEASLPPDDTDPDALSPEDEENLSLDLLSSLLPPASEKENVCLSEPEAESSEVESTSDEALYSEEDQSNNEDSAEDMIISTITDIDTDYSEKQDHDLPHSARSEASEASPSKRERRIDSIFDIFELFVFSLVAVLIITTFFFRHAVVDGDSMKNTLFDGEHLIISDFMYTPKRGDIIVCEDLTTELKDPIVKRIIALGGDRIQITYSGSVYVNGELLSEDYIIPDHPSFNPGGDNYFMIDLVVPEGELFVMGDNRPVSADSRDQRVGTISEDSVLGKVLIRFYPYDKFGTVN